MKHIFRGSFTEKNKTTKINKHSSLINQMKISGYTEKTFCERKIEPSKRCQDKLLKMLNDSLSNLKNMLDSAHFLHISLSVHKFTNKT